MMKQTNEASILHYNQQMFAINTNSNTKKTRMITYESSCISQLID